MLFFKKPKTVESLMDKCEKSYNDFNSYIHLAHSRGYHDFKVQFHKDCDHVLKEMAIAKDENLKIKLIEHFQGQLDFFSKHPFSTTKEDFEKFLDKNYPYVTKIQQIKTEHAQSIRPTVKL